MQHLDLFKLLNSHSLKMLPTKLVEICLVVLEKKSSKEKFIDGRRTVIDYYSSLELKNEITLSLFSLSSLIHLLNIYI